MMQAHSDVTVIVPSFNEAKNIGKLISMTKKLYPEIKIIVSDDGSKDGTREIVKNSKYDDVKLLDREKKKVHGLTASVVDAILETKTKYFIVIDGDLQHPPEKIGEIVKALKSGKTVVVGTREKVLVPWPFHRRLMSKSAILAGRARLMLHRVKCRDVMSGFFGMETKMAQEIIKKKGKTIQMKGYKILFDLIKNMRKTEVEEVYYQFGLRSAGKSKINSKVTYYFFKSLIS